MDLSERLPQTTDLSVPLTVAPEQWCEATVEWSLDGDSTAPEPAVMCPTPGCEDELQAYTGRFTDGTMDFDVVRCLTCGFEEHV